MCLDERNTERRGRLFPVRRSFDLPEEVWCELDEATESRLLGLLRQHADRGCAILVASHSPAVRRAADRVLTIDDGRLVA